jgi:hypothetical protein
LLKSEFIKDRIKLKKLMTTKVSCKKDNEILLEFTFLLILLKSLIATPQRQVENIKPRINE